MDSIERARWLVTQTPDTFAIHLWAICVEFAPENVVIFAEINELKSLFVLFYLNVLVYTKTTIHLSVFG